MISRFNLWSAPPPTLPLKGFYALQLVQAQLRQCTRNSV
ncbi:phage integrase family domain protein [Pseudomonas aeruginosa]|nr:phage integrase family domain protein [Pseudomonas aeruginosa]RCG87543.1 phage integrase family domain protein [Pseudomonas aeruginosa]